MRYVYENKCDDKTMRFDIYVAPIVRGMVFATAYTEIEAAMICQALNGPGQILNIAIHKSDCAIFNEPATTNGDCDCGASDIAKTTENLMAQNRASNAPVVNETDWPADWIESIQETLGLDITKLDAKCILDGLNNLGAINLGGPGALCEKEQLALTNLRQCQRQLDRDGIEVGVSREALTVTIKAMDRLIFALQIVDKLTGAPAAPAAS